jgi:hypothetical protein
MSNKQRVAMQCKAHKKIVVNVCKMALIKKVNGKKPFFVTCDATRKPKPPH